MKKAKDILNRLTLSGIVILLSVWTAVAEPSFAWENGDPTTGHFTYTVEQGITVSEGGISIDKINLATIAEEYGGSAGAEYALASVVVTITAVPDANTAWVIHNTDEMFLPELDYTATHTVSIDAGGQSYDLVLDDALRTSELFNEGQTKTLTSTAAESDPVTFTFNANSTNPNLESFLGDNGSATIGTVTDIVSSVNEQEDELNSQLEVSIPSTPQLHFVVTITYNVPEPGVLSLLVVGSAFLLRRRKIRLA